MLIIPIVCMMIFNIGVGLILSALFVFFRDMQYLWGVFTTLLMYMSAIFYTVDSFPPEIQSFSIHDGPGIRTTFFCQGCPHHCEGCHNPETWPFEGGTPMETEALVEMVTANPLCRGVTFSGGEPFAQAEGYAQLAKALKAKGYEVASYSGYTFEQLLSGTAEQKELLQTVKATGQILIFS